ncbi:MAG: hypothetical protein J0I06_21260 [Planctomycetes bacterium]|nr:hypothetical protein [Planctomycetota bacterium]
MLQGLLASGLLLAILALGLIVGTAGGVDKASGAKTIGYGILPRGTAVFLAILAPIGILAVFFLATTEKAQEQAGAIPFVLAGVATVGGLLLSVETFRRRIVLDVSGIRAFGWFGPPRSWAWADVAEVVRLSSGEYAITIHDGARVKINPLLMDRVEWLAEACREVLPPDRFPMEFQQTKIG